MTNRPGRLLPPLDTFRRCDALAAGWTDELIHAQVRAGHWRRLRRGSYVVAEAYDPLDAVDRHVVMAVAVARALGAGMVPSHTTAAALHRLDLWDARLSDVHVTRRTPGAARTEGGVRFHRGRLPDADVVAVADLPVVTVGRAVVEAASIETFDCGLVLADHALHRGDVTKQELLDRLDAMGSWPRIGNARSVVAFADGRSESAGESLARWLFERAGLPRPDLQYEVYDGDELVARTDFCWEAEKVVVEFDGRSKYGDERAATSTALFEEKRREDRLRELGYVVIRLVWADLSRPRRTGDRIQRALSRRSLMR